MMRMISRDIPMYALSLLTGKSRKLVTVTSGHGMLAFIEGYLLNASLRKNCR